MPDVKTLKALCPTATVPVAANVITPLPHALVQIITAFVTVVATSPAKHPSATF